MRRRLLMMKRFLILISSRTERSDLTEFYILVNDKSSIMSLMATGK
jgi:hypothetical protein